MLNLVKYLILACSVSVSSVYAQTVTMNFTTSKGDGKPAGTIQITETKYGLLFTPFLQGMANGLHGFHIHEKSDCSNMGMAAGQHLDPLHTGKHAGPYQDNGHLGDLPALYATIDGAVTLPVLAPRLTALSQIKNHALMLHAGGDNYSDLPQPLGGGKERMVCGVIQ